MPLDRMHFQKIWPVYKKKNFNFGQTTFTGSGFLGLQSPFIPANPDKVVTGVAIGQNAYARFRQCYGWYS